MTPQDRKRQREVIAHWRESAERDWQAAQDMFKIGHYDWCLFVAHLAIEKLLKGLVEQNTETTPPKIHDLEKLAKIATISLSKEFREWFPEITDFNFEARYADEKYAFYKLATREYATRWLKRCRKVFAWLNDQFN